MIRRALTLLAAVVAALAIGVGPAMADSCANFSRPAPAGWTPETVYTAPLLKGNWLWLPSLGIPFPKWGFVTPGTEDALLLGTPNVNGNYTNGKTESLLGVSAVCDTSKHVITIRQTSHGIQSGCE